MAGGTSKYAGISFLQVGRERTVDNTHSLTLSPVAVVSD